MKLNAVLTLASSTVLLALTLGAAAVVPPLSAQEEIDLSLILEVNATDNDGEIVLRLKTDLAVERLTVFDSCHRPVLRVTSNDRGRLGLSQMVLETAEPSIPEVLEAYPEGKYHAVLKTTNHHTFHVLVDLSHDLPEHPVVTYPIAGRRVPAIGAVVTWAADPEVASWVVEIENDELEQTLTVELPGSVSSFAIPDGFLAAGETYQLGIAAIGENGNVLVVERDFDVR